MHLYIAQNGSIEFHQIILYLQFKDYAQVQYSMLKFKLYLSQLGAKLNKIGTTRKVGWLLVSS